MRADTRPPRFELQFSLKGLLIFTTAVALGAAAFRDASQAWTTIAVSTAFAMVFFSILAALFGRPPRQAFWTGFAIFAGAYFLFAVRFANSPVIFSLATTNAIDYVSNQSHPWLGSEAAMSRAPNGDGDTRSEQRFAAELTSMAPWLSAVACGILPLAQCRFNLRAGDDVSSDVDVTSKLPLIGHAECTLLLGLCGGLLASGVASRRLRPIANSATVVISAAERSL